MAVIRDITGGQPRADLAELTRAAAAAEQARRAQQPLDRVVTGLFQVGLSLQDAADLPHEAATQRIADVWAAWTRRSARSATTCSPPSRPPGGLIRRRTDPKEGSPRA
jgi:hypothetical protein